MMRARTGMETRRQRSTHWDYSKNDAKLREFWAEGLRHRRITKKSSRSACAAMATNP